MPSLPARFISSLGLNDEKAQPDVRFLKSVSTDYKVAVAEQKRLQKILQRTKPSPKVVIFRSSHCEGKLFLSFQSPNSKGDELHRPRRLKAAKHIGYSLFSAPASLQPRALAKRVAKICDEFGQQGPPTDAGPH
jgi:hypothetical protein